MDDPYSIDKIVADFPRLFRGKSPIVPSSLPPGWQELVRHLLTDLNSTLTDAEAEAFEIIQIKEKFAGLRFYWSLGREKIVTGDIRLGGDDGVHRIRIEPEVVSSAFASIKQRVDQAQSYSNSICQDCGADGASQTKVGGWLVTLCTKCEAAECAKRETRS